MQRLLRIVRFLALIPLAIPSFGATPAVRPPSAATAVLRENPPPGDPSRGADIYEAKCGACHSLDANRVGPKHRGIFGRMAGTVPDFRYSRALKSLRIVWNAQTLDRWLQNPTAMAPGTAMGVRLSSAQDRADVIAYLRQHSPD
jgi:cytochrome c